MPFPNLMVDKVKTYSILFPIKNANKISYNIMPLGMTLTDDWNQWKNTERIMSIIYHNKNNVLAGTWCTFNSLDA